MNIDMSPFMIAFLTATELLLSVIHNIIAYILLLIDVAETYGIFVVIFFFSLSTLTSTTVVHGTFFENIIISTNNLYSIEAYKNLILLK